jgi:hypothetical protein
LKYDVSLGEFHFGEYLAVVSLETQIEIYEISCSEKIAEVKSGGAIPPVPCVCLHGIKGKVISVQAMEALMVARG